MFTCGSACNNKPNPIFAINTCCSQGRQAVKQHAHYVNTTARPTQPFTQPQSPLSHSAPDIAASSRHVCLIYFTYLTLLVQRKKGPQLQTHHSTAA